MKNIKLFVLMTVFFIGTAYAQNEGTSNEFPLKITGYMGLLHPVATLLDGEVLMNFDDSYSVGFVSGISIQKQAYLSYSLEIIPIINTNSNSNRVNNLIIQPGIHYPLKKGWTLTNRFSFETGGRYGITPSVGKVLIKGQHPVSLIIPFAMRIGNNQDFSIGTAILFTVAL